MSRSLLFHVTSVARTEDDYARYVAFGGRCGTHIIVSRARMEDDQDRNLGLVGAHIEIEDQGRSAYDAIEDVVSADDGAVIVLNAFGARELGVPSGAIRLLAAGREAEGFAEAIEAVREMLL